MLFPHLLIGALMLKRISFLPLMAIALLAGNVYAAHEESHPAVAAEQAIPAALQFSFDGLDETPIALSQFKGKAILIVNTASECGFTPQYKGLQELWKTYKDRGLVVLAVPSNDFGDQEPGSNKEIKKFCTNVYGLGFPVAGKATVKGEHAHPFYQYAAKTLGDKSKPRWNFHKYLINSDGTLVDWFSSSTEPMDRRIRQAVEQALPAAD